MVSSVNELVFLIFYMGLMMILIFLALTVLEIGDRVDSIYEMLFDIGKESEENETDKSGESQ